MRKIILVGIISTLVLGFPLYSETIEDKGKGADAVKNEEKKPQKSKESVYKDITLEDFETNPYTVEKNLKFQVTSYQEAEISIKDENPAPIISSKKYLGIKFKGNINDTLIIIPAKDITVDKYCNEISIWVYGQKIAGELSIMVRDAKDINHRIIFGRLNFLGWKKLTVKLDKSINQYDNILNQKKPIQILHLQYRPMNETYLPIWHTFYLDDITAKVREKYLDKQSSEW